MAWSRGKRVFRIEYAEGHEFHGLEFKVEGLSFKEYMEASTSDFKIAAAFMKRVIETSASVPGSSTDKPMNPTAANLRKLDSDVLITSALAWWKEVGKAHPLRQPPATGVTAAPSVEDMLADLPMEAAE